MRLHGSERIADDPAEIVVSVRRTCGSFLAGSAGCYFGFGPIDGKICGTVTSARAG
jgi:hypothetical protein